MVEYISPILGNIDEEIISAIKGFKSSGSPFLHNFLREMKERFGFGVLRTGILFVETYSEEPVVLSGTGITEYLINYKFIVRDAINITKLFSVNNRLVERLVEMGFLVDDVVYGTDLKGRLKDLGLESATVTSAYALDDVFTVYPVILPEEELPPLPPEEYVYRSQATYTYSKGKKVVELRIWFYSNKPIAEQELLDKWNEANDNAVELPSSDLSVLLDSLEPDPGFELNHKLERDEVVGNIEVWQGHLVFKDKASAKTYDYKVL